MVRSLNWIAQENQKNHITMKKLAASALALFLFMGVTMAQKFAFVDSDYILQNIPSYNAAQQELDKASEAWEAEVAKEFEAIETMYKT